MSEKRKKKKKPTRKKEKPSKQFIGQQHAKNTTKRGRHPTKKKEKRKIEHKDRIMAHIKPTKQAGSIYRKKERRREKEKKKKRKSRKKSQNKLDRTLLVGPAFILLFYFPQQQKNAPSHN